MILQDLLRNIVLYNGIINPYLQSVKEYVLTFLSPSYKHQGELLLTTEASLPQKLHILVSIPSTGTRTHSYKEFVVSGRIINANTKERVDSLKCSNPIINVLMN